jgi:hypothetical protein
MLTPDMLQHLLRKDEIRISLGFDIFLSLQSYAFETLHLSGIRIWPS